MKVLFIATVRSHIGQFHMPVIKALVEAGHTVDAAFHDNSKDKPGLDLSCIHKTFEVPFDRSPYSHQNAKAFKKLKKVIEKGDYDLIHCNTPVGGVLGRMAAKGVRKKKGTKVIYMAHGFHFYEGCPKQYKMMFYPIEKKLAKVTDVLITINEEDYKVAKTFKAGKVVKFPGVGVNLSKFHVSTPEESLKNREELGYAKDDFLMLYAADLSERKNQKMIFKAMAKIKEDLPNMKLLLPGQPILKDEYEAQCKELGISHMVEFMGYRRDIPKLLSACDCVVSSSRQEGLPLNLIEAAASGKYIISTDVRGSSDVVKQCEYGALVPLNNYDAMAKEIFWFWKNNTGTKQDVSKVQVYDESNIVNEFMGVIKSFEI